MTEPLARIRFGTDGWRALIAREFRCAGRMRYIWFHLPNQTQA